MNIKLLIEHHLEFLSLIGDCTDSSESTLIKIPHCWKSNVAESIYVELGPLLTPLPTWTSQNRRETTIKAAYPVTMNIFRKILFSF